ncbi:MAG: response regulator transcription factor [Dehalococcoidia bacterium]|nr:response regulator transcription factor [Dehalococcoidia bacterium]
MDKMKVLVVSQQAFFRQGVWHSLSENDDMEVATTDEIDQQALNEIGEQPPDVSIVDVDGSSDDCLVMARKLKQRLPKMGLILLSSTHNDSQFFQALKAQASAYMKKEVAPEELNSAVRSVARGESPIQETFTTRQKVAMQVLHKFQELSWRAENEISVSPLTSRETEILRYVSQGFLNKQIATELGISEQTIKNHVTSILRKLNASARTEAVVLAIKQGLISIS